LERRKGKKGKRGGIFHFLLWVLGRRGEGRGRTAHTYNEKKDAGTVIKTQKEGRRKYASNV